MQDLRSYLVRATLDPDFRALVLSDPEASFEGYALPDADKAILRRQDHGVLTLIARVLGDELRTAEAVELPEPAAEAELPPVRVLPDLSFEVTLSPTLLGDQLAYRANIQALGRPATRSMGTDPQWGHKLGSATAQRLAAQLQGERHAALIEVLAELTRADADETLPPPPTAAGGPAIDIVGLGIKNRDHLTLETQQILERARVVFYLDTGLATRELLEQHCAAAIPLYAEAYRDHASRVDAYHHVAARVVGAALDGEGVVFAIQGHPTVFCYPPFLIRDLARLLGLAVQIHPGISAMDCLFAELGVDPSVHGMQMYEATDLLLRRRPLQPDVPALIWQIGTVETRLHTQRRSQPARLLRFVGHLLQFYPPEHEIVAFFSTPHPLAPSMQATVRLDELMNHAPALHPGVTLYLPPVGQRPVHDLRLLEQLDSLDHLARITR